MGAGAPARTTYLPGAALYLGIVGLVVVALSVSLGWGAGWVARRA